MNTISQNIFNVIDMLIDKKLMQLQFDKTIKGQINKIIDMSIGSYQISYMDSFFIAYDLHKNNNYKIGDTVFVKIPLGDFSGKKIIEGKC